MSARRFLASAGACSVALAGVLGIGLVTATPAHAASGVIGYLRYAHFYPTNLSCMPDDTIEAKNGCLLRGNSVWVYGWALNKHTVPVQEVRFRFSGHAQYRYFDRHNVYHNVVLHRTWYSGKRVANDSRPGVRRKYHLSSSALGFHSHLLTPQYGTFIGRVQVCAYARDHGSAQAWRRVSCKYGKAAPKLR